jgi:hypothetical protein
MPDILAAATDNCRFCNWLLNEEWVHRLALAYKVLAESNNPQVALPPSVFGVVMEIAIRDSERLPPPNPRNTLCHLSEEHNRLLSGPGASQFDDLTLACFPYQGLEIRFFGLWDRYASWCSGTLISMAHCRLRHLTCVGKLGASLGTSPL